MGEGERNAVTGINSPLQTKVIVTIGLKEGLANSKAAIKEAMDMVNRVLSIVRFI